MSPTSRTGSRRTGSRRSKRHVLITAGPTREYVDPVRYLSNESSGKMGFAIASAAVAQGDRVTLIAGPVRLETPPGVRRIDVSSAREMLRAVRSEFRDADALIMAAAVADWRPARKLAGKWRKKDQKTETASLELVKNPDILSLVARQKGDRLVVGFALETGDGVRRALRKLRRKNADYIILNDESVLGSERATVTILATDGSSVRLENKTKRAVAKALVALEKI